MITQPFKPRYFARSEFKLTARLMPGNLFAPTETVVHEFPDQASFYSSVSQARWNPNWKTEFIEVAVRPERAQKLKRYSVISLVASGLAAGHHLLTSHPVSAAVSLLGLLNAGFLAKEGFEAEKQPFEFTHKRV
jgi:hypothetical protein